MAQRKRAGRSPQARHGKKSRPSCHDKRARLVRPNLRRRRTEAASVPLVGAIGGWVAAMSRLLDARIAFRLPIIVAGAMLAGGRRTAARWLRAGGVHDRYGRLERVSDPNVAYTYAYDVKGRLSGTTVAGLTSSDFTLVRTFDAHDRLLDVADSLGGATTYAYDAAGRLAEARFFDGSSTAAVAAVWYGYDALNRVDRIDRQAGAPVIRTALTYDPQGRVGDMATSIVGGGAISAGSFHYGYDEHNRLTEYVGPEGTKTYQYDGRGQLAKVLDGQAATLESYDYDAQGNREAAGSAAIGSSVSYTPGVQNRITSDGTYNYEYDAEGNRTAKVTIVGGAREEYQWDFRNRLKRVVFKDGGGAVTGSFEYRYDAANRRIVKRELDASETLVSEERYLYDGDTLLVVLDGTEAVQTRQFLVGGAVVGQQRAGEVFEWLLVDHQGSTRALVDGTGAVGAEFAFDAYGNVLAGSDDLGLVYSGWTGLVYDAETGNHYAWNRYYDPRLGEWISNDPIGFAGGTANLSEYVGNGPTNGVDPTGLEVTWGDAWNFLLYGSLAPYAKKVNGEVDRAAAATFDQSKIVASKVADGDFAGAHRSANVFVASVVTESETLRFNVLGFNYLANKAEKRLEELDPESAFNGRRASAGYENLGFALVPGSNAAAAEGRGMVVAGRGWIDDFGRWSDDFLELGTQGTSGRYTIVVERGSDGVYRAAQIADDVVPATRLLEGPKSNAIAEPLLLTHQPTTMSIEKMRRLPQPQKWRMGEQIMRELSGSSGQRHFPTTWSGGRFVDAPVDLPSGAIFAGEVKTYNSWTTIEGAAMQQTVEWSERLQRQIFTDVWLRRHVAGYDPRWIFMDAPPSPELLDRLNAARIMSVIHH